MLYIVLRMAYQEAKHTLSTSHLAKVELESIFEGINSSTLTKLLPMVLPYKLLSSLVTRARSCKICCLMVHLLIVEENFPARVAVALQVAELQNNNGGSRKKPQSCGVHQIAESKLIVGKLCYNTLVASYWCIRQYQSSTIILCDLL